MYNFTIHLDRYLHVGWGEREREREREILVIVTLLLYFYSNGTARRARVVVAHRFPYLFDR
jgi:hypothetical protein